MGVVISEVFEVGARPASIPHGCQGFFIIVFPKSRGPGGQSPPRAVIIQTASATGHGKER